MDDAAHDKEHIYRVLYNALEIAKTEKDVNYDVLIAACLLHDIGRKEQFENPALCHAIVGSEKACQFLVTHGFETFFAEQVKQCISSTGGRFFAARFAATRAETVGIISFFATK